MGIRDQLRSSIKKDGPRRKHGIWHSKAYHRFFEGYSEIAVPKPNGKGYSIQRIYTGNYYRQHLTGGQRTLLRVLYGALFLSAAYLFISAAGMPLASNSTWYVTLPQAASLPFLFWIIIAFVSYLPAGWELTIHEYRSSSLALKKATLGSAISLGITVCAVILFLIINPSSSLALELTRAAKYLAAGIFAFVMNWVERRVEYCVTPSHNLPPEDSVIN